MNIVIKYNNTIISNYKWKHTIDKNNNQDYLITTMSIFQFGYLILI